MEPQGQAPSQDQPRQTRFYGQVVCGLLVRISRKRMDLPLVGLLTLRLVGLLIAAAFALFQWMILATLLVSAWQLTLPILLCEAIGSWMLVRHYIRVSKSTGQSKSVANPHQLVRALWNRAHERVDPRRRAESEAAWKAWYLRELAQERADRDAAVRAQQAEHARFQAIEVQRWAEDERARQVERARLEAIRAQRREEDERIRQAEVSRRKTLNGLLSLSPTEFERAVGAMLVTYGYSHVKHTGGAGDLAADLICFDSDGNRIVVQCKRYAVNNLVGSREVQMFIGMAQVHHKATRGLFVTTSDFTQPARTLGNSHREFLTLIDGKLLTKMMQRLS